jgi:hypothetical protein
MRQDGQEDDDVTIGHRKRNDLGYHPVYKKFGYAVFRGYIPQKAIGTKQVVLTARPIRIASVKAADIDRL